MKMFCSKMMRIIFILLYYSTYITGESSLRHATITADSMQTYMKWPEFHVQDVVELTISQNKRVVLEGTMGDGLELNLGPPDTTCLFGDVCVSWKDYGIKLVATNKGECTDFTFKRVEGCHQQVSESLWACWKSHDDWYGGGEQFYQRWPIQSQARSESLYMPGDFLQNRTHYWGGIAERFWLSSSGTVIHVSDDTPLFFSLQNDNETTTMCFTAKHEHPYKPHPVLLLKYSICRYENIKKAYLESAGKLFALPFDIPDGNMLTYPVFSTWAMYKKDINQSTVVDFVSKIKQHGLLSRQIEIDDDWENCYGELNFNKKKFPHVKSLVSKLQEDGFRVSLWIHPFINADCHEIFNFASKHGYLIKDKDGVTSRTQWWNGNDAGLIDATNADAAAWFVGRLKSLRDITGIDSFKFDAGEYVWLPYDYILNASLDLHPAHYITSFVKMAEKFGRGIEVRVGFKTQKYPVFVRMLDKFSTWDYGNGLASLIPTNFLFGITGYPFVYPDMIGGNAYSEADHLISDYPDKELFIRWTQANALMPAMQFSIAPWIYDDVTIGIVREMINLHIKFSDKIIELARLATRDGSPINRPLWWIAPHDNDALKCDSEYLLGDDILVAPVLTSGIKRDIYLPEGDWTDELKPNHPIYKGPVWLNEYPVEINELPYFTRKTTQ